MGECWKRPWCTERVKAEGDDRGRDGWMASPMQWTRVWVNSGSWWWQGSLACWIPWSSRVRHNWATELNCSTIKSSSTCCNKRKPAQSNKNPVQPKIKTNLKRKKLSTVFSSVQSLSHVRLFAPPWTGAPQASLSITNSRRLLKVMSIELVMPSNHLILCHPLLLLPSIFPRIRVFSNKSAFCIN